MAESITEGRAPYCRRNVDCVGGPADGCGWLRWWPGCGCSMRETSCGIRAVGGVGEQQVETLMSQGAAEVKRNIFMGIHLSNILYRSRYISYGVYRAAFYRCFMHPLKYPEPKPQQ